MKRIWNALRYGDRETKKCIGSVIFFSAVAIVLIAASGILKQFSLCIAGLISGMVALLISQTFTLVDDDFVAEVDGQGSKDTVRSVSVMKNGVSSRAQTRKEFLNSQKAMDKQDIDKTRKDDKEEAAQNEIKAAKFDHYNAQILKTVKKEYRVRKDHRPIIIDSSQSYGIKECPAFIWRAHKKVYLLLLEKEPRRICISRDLILHMDYVPDVPADKTKEYLAFEKDNLITSVFREYLPDYFDSKASNSNLKYKHLYQIYPDIRLSNRSAWQVMDLIYLNFMPDDKITRSEKLNGFFKRIYAAHIMYRDRVYSITEYKESVEKILTELCHAEMPDQEFVITLENLVRGRMISSKYANHYLEYREKVRGRRIEFSLRR